MKGTGKILFGVGFLTALMLLYVHGQVSLFHISYTLDERSETLSLRSEAYRKLKFEVEQLKAPRILEKRMKEMKLELTPPKEVRVFKVPPLESPVETPVIEAAPSPQGLSRVFGRLIGVAQAKTDSQP